LPTRAHTVAAAVPWRRQKGYQRVRRRARWSRRRSVLAADPL